MSRWISAIWTRQLVQIAGERGLETAPLCQLAGLDPARADPMSRLSDETHLRLWSEVMRKLGDPTFPVAYASRMRIDDYDALGLACKTAENVGIALGRIVRYLRIWTNAVELETSTESDGIRLSLAREGIRDVGYRAAMESALAEVLQAVRGLADRSFSAERVQFAHAHPDVPLGRHREFFGVTPECGARGYALVLSRATVAQPLALADPGLSRFLLEHLERMAGAEIDDAPFEERVIDAIGRELPSGTPTASRIALRLGTSQRNLQRLLARSGKSFQDLVAETRCKLALHLLEQSRHSLAEISFLLGFSEPSAFHRAFKRWTGRTPAEIRNPPGTRQKRNALDRDEG